MSADSYWELKNHVGHEIECVTYGKKPWANVALECVTCSEILLDYDRPAYIRRGPHGNQAKSR